MEIKKTEKSLINYMLIIYLILIVIINYVSSSGLMKI